MNSSDLREALRRDAEMVGEPPSDLLEQVWDRRRRSSRRRLGVVAVAFGVAVVGAGIPVGAALLSPSTTGGMVAAPATFPAAAPGGITTPSIEDQQATLAADFGIADPPDVPVVQLVTPEQRKAVVEACMTEQGYPLIDGAHTIPNDEIGEFDLASYICMASYPVDPAYVMPAE